LGSQLPFRICSLKQPQVRLPGWDFEPDVLRIKQGTTVVVTDQGGEPHTFTEGRNLAAGLLMP
jgi:hypothetical protein